MVCERWVETGTDCYIYPTSSLDHSTLCYVQEPTEYFFRLLTGVAQPEVAEGNSSQRGVLSLQAGSYSGLLVSNWLNYRGHLPILFHSAHLLPLRLPLIYTGVSLIDGSIKGQYVTLIQRDWLRLTPKSVLEGCVSWINHTDKKRTLQNWAVF